MQLVEQHIIKNNEWMHWCAKAKELYNQTLYYWRQSVFGNIQYFTEYEIVKLMQDFNEPTFRSLPANTSQQIIKNLFKNTKAWQNAKEEYNKNKSKFLGLPKMPKYKKELSTLYFTYAQIRPSEGLLKFPKMMKVSPIKTKIKKEQFKQCRIIPKNDHFVIEIIYEVEEVKIKEITESQIGVDLGLNNLACIVSTKGVSQIINGRPIKSINAFYNKRTSKLKSLLSIGQNTSNRIRRLSRCKNQKIKNYLHHVSKKIANIAKETNCTQVIIGNNKNWKHEINLGKRNNQNFVSIPYCTLIGQIEYKLKMLGISVIIHEESYTSKCSSYDMELIKKHDKYLGSRVKRGLFKTKDNLYVNADANGAVNILRKVSENYVLKNIDSVRSCVVQPVKIRNIYSMFSKIANN